MRFDQDWWHFRGEALHVLATGRIAYIDGHVGGQADEGRDTMAIASAHTPRRTVEVAA